MIDRFHRLRRHSALLSRCSYAQSRTQAATPPSREPVGQEMRIRLTNSPSPACLLAPSATGQRQLGRPRPRLRPRSRDERVRRLRLRQARQGLPLHPRPLLHRGRRLGTISGPRIVRVLLDISSDDVGFSGATSACGKALDPRRNYEAHRVGGSVQLRSSGGKPLADCGHRLRAAGAGQDHDRRRRHLPRAPSRRCRPKATAARSTSSTRSPIDQYVKGVIPNESPPSWPMAELRAQAVASRSFALTAGVGGNGFDLYADTRSQVYKGLESETARSNAAAEATRGQVVEYDGKIAETLLLRLLGRPHRERPERLLRPRDPLPGRRPRPLRLLLPAAQLDAPVQRSARSAPSWAAYLDGRLKQVVITKRGVSPRIVAARLYGTGGVTTVSGEAARVGARRLQHLDDVPEDHEVRPSQPSG